MTARASCRAGTPTLAASTRGRRRGSGVGRSRGARAARLVGLLLAAVTALAAPGGRGGAARAGELVVDGSFESGTFASAWRHGAFRGNNSNPNLADHAVVLDLPRSGNYAALLGFKYTRQRANTFAWLAQDVTIPAGISSATLRFGVRVQGYDSAPWDPFRMEIRSTGDATLATVLDYAFTEYSNNFKDSGWLDDDTMLPVGYDMTAFAGQTVRLYFEQSNLFDNLYETWAFVDDVSLVYRMWIDLVVDGNGDDAFGAPGSGAGGLGAHSGVALDTLRYALVLENEGTVSDAYVLAAAVPAGWSVTVDDGSGPAALPWTSPVLAPSERRAVTVRVVPDAAAPGGVTDVVLDARSTSDPSRFDSVTLRASVVPARFGVDAVVDGNGVGVVDPAGGGGFALRVAPWDSAVTFTVDLRNTGNAATAMVVTPSVPPGVAAVAVYAGTAYPGAFVTAPVAPGASARVDWMLTGPAPLPGGDHPARLRVAAASDTLRVDAVTTVLRLRAPRVDLVLATSGDDVYGAAGTGAGGASTAAGERGTVVVFPLQVQNEGAVTDSFALSWTPPGNGWSAAVRIDGVDRPLPLTTPAIAAFGQADWELRVNVPPVAAYGTYASLLDAVSLVDGRVTESVAPSVSVASPSEIDLTIDGDGLSVYGPVGTGLGGSAARTAAPGDTVTFALDVRNVAGTNRVDLDWTVPPGWIVTVGGAPPPRAAIPAGLYALTVVVPPDAPGGTVDVIVDAHKSDKPFYMDSVTGRVIVVPPVRVDALIDGHGDGLYGTPGLGDGGASLQTTSAPATLAWTLELQNEGPVATRYRVTWTAPAGWTVTLDGSPSGSWTAPVGPGAASTHALRVDVPAGALVGSDVVIVDVVAEADSLAVESVSARVDVVSPPRADLVIDGDGAGVFGPAGSGQGGRALRFVAPGATVAVPLELRNVGSLPDSFRVAWSAPPGWPAGSVTIDDGATVHVGPFWSREIAPGGSATWTLRVAAPGGIAARTDVVVDAVSSRPPNAWESVALEVDPRARLEGFVFDDRDHDGVRDPGEPGRAGVAVRAGDALAVTGADGAWFAWVLPPGAVTVTAATGSGWVSITPDTVGPFAPPAGDTVRVDFADVPALASSPGGARPGLAGAWVDFPHAFATAAAGTLAVTATATGGATTLLYLDADADGAFGPGDRPLAPGDGVFDPAAGRVRLDVVVRVFVPAATPAGTTLRVRVDGAMPLPPSAVVLRAGADDAVVVTGSALGRLSLHKAADRAGAAPGDVITYTVTFRNLGADSLADVALFDPVSAWLDPVPGAFGPGRDVEWIDGSGAPVYLTFDPADADACSWNGAERLLRLDFSRTGPYFLAPGGSGVIRYRARVR